MKRKEKQKQQRIHHQIGFWPTSRLNQHWEVLCRSTSGIPTGKRSQAVTPLCGWDFKDCHSMFPFIIPGSKQISSSIFEQNCSSGIMLNFIMLFALFWNLGLLLSPGSHWPDLLQGLKEFQDPYLPTVFLSWHSQQAWLAPTAVVRAASRWVRSKVRGLLCLSLKSKQDYLFNFPNTRVNLIGSKWSREKANRVFPRECIDHT